jgi:hypothetical protein
MCWRPQTSGYSYLRVATIRIDVHPIGETQPTHHTHPTLSLSMVPNHTYLTWSMHSNLLCNRQQSWAGLLLPRKRASDTIHSTPADWSMGSYLVSLPKTAIEAVEAKPIFCSQPGTRLTGPISLACDWYVQYLLVGSNPSVLNWHRQVLQPWRCRHSTSHSPTFPTDGPPLST